MDNQQLNQEMSEQLEQGYKNIQEMMSAPYDEYVAFLKKSTIGEMSGFRALLEQELTRVEVTVQELQKSLLENVPQKAKLETYGNLYGYVFRISDRLMMLHAELRDRMASLNEEFKK